MIEEHLIHCAQSGDKEALEKLIRKYYDKIYAYCYHHTENRQIAEDLCQETFCSLLENLDNYRHYGKLQNYLYIIAGNKCKDYFKKKKPLYFDELPEDRAESYGLESDYEIKEVVEKMPQELKEVVILRFYQDLKYQDIAQILQISNSLAKHRVKKALSFLREELEGSMK